MICFFTEASSFLISVIKHLIIILAHFSAFVNTAEQTLQNHFHEFITPPLAILHKHHGTIRYYKKLQNGNKNFFGQLKV